jgi:hypothetical protein
MPQSGAGRIKERDQPPLTGGSADLGSELRTVIARILLRRHAEGQNLHLRFPASAP